MTDVEMADGKSRVVAAVEAISGDRDKAVAWLQEPIATFGGKTPLELVAEGRTDDLLGYIQSFESGYVG
ncbi:MbcA/ParS/Xre antitoxin family protein [Luteibacter sp. 329MFSha]|uniref:MbcA/ParS/Xre antitoxin family protein n=1 Tax=Luteibacter sp. 329MFSha TaxID=1798239 RepID=UPI0015875550|nr:MbcA/ParS/Xre antitoxin family protein [Luteibacter sp. 329MFSha]